MPRTSARVQLGSNYLPFYRHSTPYHRAVTKVIESIPIEERRNAYRSLIRARRTPNEDNVISIPEYIQQRMTNDTAESLYNALRDQDAIYKDMRKIIEDTFKEMMGVNLRVCDDGKIKDLDVIEFVDGAHVDIIFNNDQERTMFLLSNE